MIKSEWHVIIRLEKISSRNAAVILASAESGVIIFIFGTETTLAAAAVLKTHGIGCYCWWYTDGDEKKVRFSFQSLRLVSIKIICALIPCIRGGGILLASGWWSKSLQIPLKCNIRVESMNQTARWKLEIQLTERVHIGFWSHHQRGVTVTMVIPEQLTRRSNCYTFLLKNTQS